MGETDRADDRTRSEGSGRPALLSYWRAWWRAFRFFSLTGAFVPTLLGAVLAWRDGPISYFDAALVIIGGCAIQGAVNLVNDFFEFKHGVLPEKNRDLGIFGTQRTALERFIFITGILMFLSVVPIGFYLAWKSGWPLLVIGFIGLTGGYFYTGPPFNYKNRALGWLFAFLLTGVLLVVGAYYALRGRFSALSFWASLPIDFLITALIISNEVRDAEDDREKGIGTFTCRAGIENGRRFYWFLVVSAYVSLAALIAARVVAWPAALSLLSLLVLRQVPRYLYAPRGQRKKAVLLSARVHLWFGLLYTAGIALAHALGM